MTLKVKVICLKLFFTVYLLTLVLSCQNLMTWMFKNKDKGGLETTNKFPLWNNISVYLIKCLGFSKNNINNMTFEL